MEEHFSGSQGAHTWLPSGGGPPATHASKTSNITRVTVTGRLLLVLLKLELLLMLLLLLTLLSLLLLLLLLLLTMLLLLRLLLLLLLLIVAMLLPLISLVLLQAEPSLRLTVREILSSPWLSDHVSVPATPLETPRVLQEKTSQWSQLQEELSLTLTEMRHGDPEQALVTLRNPRLEGSSKLARRRRGLEQEQEVQHKRSRVLDSVESRGSNDSGQEGTVNE